MFWPEANTLKPISVLTILVRLFATAHFTLTGTWLEM
jgi:hypothetical protein